MAYRIAKEKSKTTGKTHLSYVFEEGGARVRRSLKLSYKTNPTTADERMEKKIVESNYDANTRHKTLCQTRGQLPPTIG